MRTHLSADLRKKYGFRNIQVKKGDTVKILRGQFKKKEGRIERVNIKQEKVFVTGIEFIKKDGAKVPVPINPSKIMLVELDLGDKKRKQKIESKSKAKAEKVQAK